MSVLVPDTGMQLYILCRDILVVSDYKHGCIFFQMDVSPASIVGVNPIEMLGNVDSGSFEMGLATLRHRAFVFITGSGHF